ncbi:radical SAM protein [Streptomyces sp. NRRL S-1448]|uniref:radical SAM protein n=1 Tax=Streptomyces sp. NRRL S-1448 TaxID=1463883 RepID=UPI001F18E1B8|nr:radical SAM protein [Streptomyces sp. NRRL S-1448]
MEVTGLCNELCDHCYADSSPKGTHGAMTVADWVRVIDQLAEMSVADVQFIGGEPTLYPHLPELITHAHGAGLGIEVFSNLTHIREPLWGTFVECGVKLATSYYSDVAEEHDSVTNLRGSHKKTRANIEKARSLGLTIRGGVVAVNAQQRVQQAVEDLSALGAAVGTDRNRAFGRASKGARPAIEDLCGHCALGQVAIGPDGVEWPCVLGRFISLGDVRQSSIAQIWTSASTAEVRAEIAAVHESVARGEACTPPQFLPSCGPCNPCVPSVGFCDPRDAAAGTDSIGMPLSHR